ncbi:MAG: hemolysin family protein [Anaerolineae bacterium]
MFGIFLVILILIFINALYVAAEFATISSRRSRLAQMAEEGNQTARYVLTIVEDPHKLDTYIAACQLGITISSLVLGFYAQSALNETTTHWLARLGIVSELTAASLSATVILLVLTGFQVVLGELVPKNIGVQYPERLALLTAWPMRWSLILFRPLTWFFNGSGQLVLKLLGVEPTSEHAQAHTAEEIALLVEESGEGGLLDQQERRLIENTLWMRRSSVRQIMVPRTRVLAASVDTPSAELFSRLAKSYFSRLPLYEGSVDNIIGVIHLKDLLCLHDAQGENEVNMRDVMTPALFIPESMPADEAFSLLQHKRYHVAVVLDEYGGTAGIVTLEDLIEEIFGEVQDEFDQEVPLFRVMPGNRVLVRWDWLISDLNELLDLKLPTEEAETIGGLMLNELAHVPEVGEMVDVAGVPLCVERVEGNAVAAVSLPATPDQVERMREETSS